jgi:hypothetical protein
MLVVLGVFVASCSGDRSNPRSLSAQDSRPDFAIVTDDEGGAAVVTGSEVVRVDRLEPLGLSFAGYDESHVAFAGGDRVGLVARDGSFEQTSCVRCAGVFVYGDEIITARDNYQPGGGFDVVRLGPDLETRSVTPARRLTERIASDSLGENLYGVPSVVASSSDRFWVVYMSRNGGARGGPELVVSYDWSGRLRGHVKVPGLLLESALSSDGRYLAVGYGGSGGACVTRVDLGIVDLKAMSFTPGTVDELPAGVDVPVGSFSGGWFFAKELSWEGTTVSAVGEVHVPDDSGCDEDPETWTRTYDTATTEYRDTRPASEVTVGAFGESCADWVTMDLATGTMSVSDDRTRFSLDGYTSLAYAAGC